MDEFFDKLFVFFFSNPAMSPPKVKTGSSTVTVVELTVVVVPLTVKSPPTVVLPFAASTVKVSPSLFEYEFEKQNLGL